MLKSLIVWIGLIIMFSAALAQSDTIRGTFRLRVLDTTDKPNVILLAKDGKKSYKVLAVQTKSCNQGLAIRPTEAVALTLTLANHTWVSDSVWLQHYPGQGLYVIGGEKSRAIIKPGEMLYLSEGLCFCNGSIYRK